MERKSSSSKKSVKNEKVKSEKQISLFTFSLLAFFLLAWVWASWWMGDIFRVAYEQSFFASDATLMHFLLQKSFGWLWLAGRALLTLYHWPLLGGLLVTLMLTATTWSMAKLLRGDGHSPFYILHFTLSILPACAWMSWTAWTGLNLFYETEPGRTLGVLLVMFIVSAAIALIVRLIRGKAAQEQQHSEQDNRNNITLSLIPYFLSLVLSFAIPVAITHLRHPYARPVTRMQVQLLHDDWKGMVATAHDNATLSYRPLAAYYAIALVHTGHLTDALFDIRLDYDSLYLYNYSRKPDNGTNYYLVDCDYTTGLFRAATHKAMEHLTMNGPTLYSLKHLTRLALLDDAWSLARKYLSIIDKAPFESDFVSHYSAMLDNPDAVAADPEFALLRRTEPVIDSFESQHQEPTFLGYTATLTAGRTPDALMQSIMANLYSKRMPDFLMRCEPLVGSMPPRTIAEGLVTQCVKNPDILKAFPQLQMNAQIYRGFLQNVQSAMTDRPAHARELFDSYRGYYPYYYFFGNLKATRKATDKEHASSNVGVN